VTSDVIERRVRVVFYQSGALESSLLTILDRTLTGRTRSEYLRRLASQGHATHRLFALAGTLPQGIVPAEECMAQDYAARVFPLRLRYSTQHEVDALIPFWQEADRLAGRRRGHWLRERVLLGFWMETQQLRDRAALSRCFGLEAQPVDPPPARQAAPAGGGGGDAPRVPPRLAGLMPRA